MDETADTTPKEASPPALRALAGAAAPPEMAADLERVLALPARAKQGLWEVLGPCLAEPVTKDVEARLDRFCQAHELVGSQLARAIKACRFLLRQAAALDLSRAEFAEDLGRLSAHGAALGAILLPGYETAKAVVRAEIARAALVDHGRVVEGVDWRIDHVVASSQGEGLRVPLAVVTLRCREGDREERITVQVPPEAARELKRLCDKLLG